MTMEPKQCGGNPPGDGELLQNLEIAARDYRSPYYQQLFAGAAAEIRRLKGKLDSTETERKRLAYVVHQRSDAIGFAIDWLQSFNQPPQTTRDERDEVIKVLRGEIPAPYPSAAAAAKEKA